MNTILLCILGGGIGAATVNLLDNLIQKLMERSGKHMSKIDKQVNALWESQRFMMLDKIVTMGNRFVESGSVTFSELRVFNEMYQIYCSKLEGNGDAETIHDMVNSLSVVKE
ncbi:MAG: hypothetical protein Q8873_04855 [Bacillota bacterium]|nr:hypothetical protein [Bacillota bacterium]